MRFHLLARIFFLLYLSPFSYSIDVRRLRGHTRFNSYLKLKKRDVPPSSSAFNPMQVKQLSWHPRAFLYSGFLKDAECDHLINLDEIISRIEDRIATWTFLPEENGEAIEIIHYKRGEKYELHYDFFSDKANQGIGGHRIATVLMYLSSVEMGGETIFPDLELKDSQLKDDSWSECARNGFAVKPKKGDALLFFSLHLNASTDDDSSHGSCPVIKGEKWSATKWIHVRPFDPFAKTLESSEDCMDEDEFCSDWAAKGECQKNPLYMVGSPTLNGLCRKSCKVCQS